MPTNIKAFEEGHITKNKPTTKTSNIHARSQVYAHAHALESKNTQLRHLPRTKVRTDLRKIPAAVLTFADLANTLPGEEIHDLTKGTRSSWSAVVSN
ncbi:hypothetical protein T4E_4287 [Trichinella pseudospiralis]|uniref:Uncharacterized protein n=1 Tax=Trichinella pseudospiralis TaxID=6337 RepID=A0A0V0XFG0_TRIPS|nr:hypothetical protein T4E_4287 [Trichinella pseudospiralis]